MIRVHGIYQRPIIGINAVVQENYTRKRTDNIELEQTPPIEPLWKSCAAGFSLLMFIAIILIVL